MDIVGYSGYNRDVQSTPTMANVGALGVPLAVLFVMIDMGAAAVCRTEFGSAAAAAETCVTRSALGVGNVLEPTPK